MHLHPTGASKIFSGTVKEVIELIVNFLPSPVVNMQRSPKHGKLEDNKNLVIHTSLCVETESSGKTWRSINGTKSILRVDSQ